MKLIRPTKEDILRKNAELKARKIVTKIKQDPSYIELPEFEGDNSQFEKIIAETLYEFGLIKNGKE